MKHKQFRIGKLVLPYVMILPAVALLAVFTFYPLFNMVYLSFFKYDMLTPKKFVGWDNYYQLFFVNIDFIAALKNTVFYTLGVIVFMISLDLIFALWLQRSTWVNAIVQRFMFLPHICAMLTVAMVFQWLMDDRGLFNAVLSVFNLPALRWLNSSHTALLSILIVAIWKGVGYYALILLSSVKSIPPELLEAADLDDAGKLRTFFKITLPMLSPQLFFLLITITINSFKVFDAVRIMTGGGPGNSSDVLVFYIYRQAFNYSKYGLSAAAGTILLLILLVMTVIYFRILGKRVHYQ